MFYCKNHVFQTVNNLFITNVRQVAYPFQELTRPLINAGSCPMFYRIFPATRSKNASSALNISWPYGMKPVINRMMPGPKGAIRE